MAVKIKYDLEFVVQASPQLLYQYIVTPSGLSEWFADNVNSRGEKFSFFWDDSEEEAILLRKKTNEFSRFRWLNGDDDQEECFFEMRIVVDELTKDVSLMVSGFTFLRNTSKLYYPIEESILSILDLVDEFVIALG